MIGVYRFWLVSGASSVRMVVYNSQGPFIRETGLRQLDVLAFVLYSTSYAGYLHRSTRTRTFCR